MSFTDYSKAFQGAEQKYGLPPGTLGGIGYVESRYNPKAVSPKGAQGLMQFMPTTAKNLGLSNPFDPNASIDAAGNLMHQNMQATHGNLQNALMMYNAGTNPSKWQPSYADQVQSHMQPPNPYYQQPQPQPGGQPQMPPQMPPQRPPMAPMSLAGLQSTAPIQSQAPSLASLAQGPPPGSIPAKKHSAFNFANIMGVIGDGLSAYGGRQPTFGPMLNQEHMMEQQQGFEREKYQQSIAMQLAMMSSGLDTETGKRLLAAGVHPGTPEWQQAMQTASTNELDPVVMTLQGPMLRSQITGAGTVGGAPAPAGVTFTPIGGQ